MTDSNEVWIGEAAAYAQTRPTPPGVLPEILTQLIGTPHPALVVDLGSGTGLSTVIWGDRAERVIGIDPSDDMRAQAVSMLATHPSAAKIAFQAGVAHDTGLPGGSVDIVTCAQSFHWMEPTATLAEIARILRPGGMFAAYDYSWPPAINWELEQVFQEVDARFDQLIAERADSQTTPRWPKEGHLDRIRDSGHFRFTRELLVHHTERGNAERFIGLVLSSGYSYQLKCGIITEAEIGLDRLKQAAARYIGSTPIPWYFSYHVRLGIR